MNAGATISDGMRRIVAKIAKLLRRAERDDGPEATTARRMAEQLMAKHGVEVDLQEFDAGPEPVVAERIVMFLRDRSRYMWAQVLLQELAPLYGCVNKQVSSDAGIQFAIVGPAAHVEPAAIHFEFLRRRVHEIAEIVGEKLGYSPLDFFSELTGAPAPYAAGEPRVVDGVHSGVLDGLLGNLKRKLAKNARIMEDVPTMEAKITRLEPRLALAPSDHVAVRGDEIAACAEDMTPFVDLTKQPPDIDEPEPPYWAWHAGWVAVKATEPCEPPDVLFEDITALGLSESVLAILLEDRIHKVAQLVRTPRAALSALDGIHEGEILEILDALSDHDLALALDWEDGV